MPAIEGRVGGIRAEPRVLWRVREMFLGSPVMLVEVPGINWGGCNLEVEFPSKVPCWQIERRGWGIRSRGALAQSRHTGVHLRN